MKSNSYGLMSALNESFMKDIEEKRAKTLKESQNLKESVFEIDYAPDDTDLSSEESIIQSVKEWLGPLSKTVDVHVEEVHGPGSGWPLVRLSGDEKEISDFLYKNYNSGTDSIEDILDLYLIESDNRTYKDKDEAEYYRNKELYAHSCLARHKEAMDKAAKACKEKGIKLDEAVSENEIIELHQRIESAEDADEIQEIIYTISDGILEDEVQRAYDQSLVDNDSLEDMKGFVLSTLEDNAEYLDESQKLNETGEWDDSDEEMQLWLEDLRLQAEEIARNIDGEVKTVKGFDAYRGPFAIIHSPKHGDVELWYDQEDDTGRSFNCKVAHVGWLNGSVGDISLWLNQDKIPEEFIINESTESENLNKNQILNEDSLDPLELLISGDDVYFRNEADIPLVGRYANSYPQPEEYDEGFLPENGGTEEELQKAKEAYEAGDVWQFDEVHEDTLTSTGDVYAIIYGQDDLAKFINTLRYVKIVKRLEEIDKNTYKDKDEAEYYRNKELYSNSNLARHKEAMEKARKACNKKGIKLKESKLIWTFAVYIDGLQPVMYGDDWSVEDAKKEYIENEGKGHDISEVKVEYFDEPVIEELGESEEKPKRITKLVDKAKMNEEDLVQVNAVQKEPDYVITDVTELEDTTPGDVQSPDIDAMLTMIQESIREEYGQDAINIHIHSSNLIENGSFALVDIQTPEILKEFEKVNSKDTAVGKSLILENKVNGLFEFRVNNTTGTTRYIKRTRKPAQAIYEWLETEFLSEAKKAKEEEKRVHYRTKLEDTINQFLSTNKDLQLAIETIKMYIEAVGKEGKEQIQDMIEKIIVEFPASITTTDDSLKFDSREDIIELIFGKEWVKDKPDEVKPAVPGGEVIKESENLNESYQQFNIGEIEVVYNPETQEVMYSIGADDTHDKKINLSKIPSVDTPYNTETIIKNYIERQYGEIPEEIENKEETQEDLPLPTEEVVTDEVIEEDAGEELENPIEQDAEIPQEDQEAIEDSKSETGSAKFQKIKPNSGVSVEDIRDNIKDGVAQADSSYIVVEERELSDEEFNDLTEDLSQNEDFFVGVTPIDRKNYAFNVVKITNASSTFDILADPVGYNYRKVYCNS